jgi:hypothetical protein
LTIFLMCFIIQNPFPRKAVPHGTNFIVPSTSTLMEGLFLCYDVSTLF